MADKVSQNIDNYIIMFRDIYEPVQNLENSFHQILAKLVESLTPCAQLITKNKIEDIKIRIPVIFAWFIALVNKSIIKEISFNEIVWSKYPYICPYCLSGENTNNSVCICNGMTKVKLRENLEKIKNFSIENAKLKPKTLKDWQTLFGNVYPKKFSESEIKAIVLHIYEEIGETSEAYRLKYYNKAYLFNELSDIFTWIIALANAFEDECGYDLQASVRSKYQDKCHICKLKPCKCTKLIKEPRLTSEDWNSHDDIENWSTYQELALKFHKKKI